MTLALATVADVQARAQAAIADDDARVLALLRDVSAAVRAFTRQSITQDTTTAMVPLGVDGVARLPQRPVSDVVDVATLDGDPVTGWVWRPGAQQVSGISGRAALADGMVLVTYTHGYPPGHATLTAVSGIVAGVAARVYGRPADTTGNTAETIGGYSYQVGGAAAAGGWGLLRDEKTALRRLLGVTGAASVPVAP